MPDVTVSFTDAQWARIVAASSNIKDSINDTGNVDANYLATKWKTEVTRLVQAYERQQASIDDF
jgi:hypothetical protein|tara:strand:+ start:1893 stop:2084 length:192 start_codon:yes stop_codon:yes gene_type:complete